MAALSGCQPKERFISNVVNLHGTHTHSESNANFLTLLHFEVPKDGPWEKSKDHIHAPGVCYNT
jgi:hypothetical protein